jgi:hypothetical protein
VRVYLLINYVIGRATFPYASRHVRLMHPDMLGYIAEEDFVLRHRFRHDLLGWHDKHSMLSMLG